MQTIPTYVAELMSMPVVVIGPESCASEVLTLAEAEDLHHFPVVEEGRLVGLVCTCDLEDLQPDQNVLAVAWRHVITLPPDGCLTDAARLMTLHGVGSIVIVDEEGVCGIVTREDLVKTDPKLDNLLFEARCAACDARSHLRPGADGQCLCRSCQVRAKDPNWAEPGGGE